MAEATRLGERLVQAGLVTSSAVAQALELQKRAGGRLGDCLVELRLMTEQALLRFLAAELNTRYVSAEKLAKVKVEPDVLDRVPVRMAEKVGLLPIAYDTEKRILSVVMAEPQNMETLEELKVVARAEQVVSFIALLSSVTAGIKKFYYGDPSAFALIEASAAQQKKDLGSMGEAYEQTRPGTRQLQTGDLQVSAGTYSGPGPNPSSIARMAQDGRSISQVSVPGGAPTSVRRAMDAIQRASVMSDNDYIETLNVLVGLLELQGPHRGHSARIAKQARAVGQRMGLSHRELNYLTIASYLHELGKSAPHTTLFSVASSEAHRLAAKRDLRTPVKLFESVHLPSQVSTILMQSYEAFDGSGLPQGVKGEDIALGARILAAVDSYEDLLTNAERAGGVLPKADALRVLAAQSGKLFDPAVLEVLRQVGTGEILRQRIIAEGHQVLLAEPDEASRVGLTRALSQAGLSVTAVSNSELALHHATVGDADLVIAAVSLQPDDAFVLAAELRAEPLTASLPVILLADTDEQNVRERAAQLGVASILQKPIDEEQLAQSTKRLLEERLLGGAPHRPVQGSIEELALPDLLRILASSQRSGQVVVQTDDAKGELYLEQGRLVHAVCGPLRGREALQKVIGFRSGDFRIDPNFLILEQQVNLDIEVALREANARPGSGAAAAT